MTRRVTPMLHVPDVRKTIEWYEAIGFTLLDAGKDDDDGEIVWAEMAFGSGRVMFSAGGRAGMGERRDVDLYVHTEDVDGTHARLANRVEVLVELNDTFYGMREFIIRDVNGFWLTFGQPLGDRRGGLDGSSQAART